MNLDFRFEAKFCGFPENSSPHSPFSSVENFLDDSQTIRLPPIGIVPVNLPRIRLISPLYLCGFDAQKFA